MGYQEILKLPQSNDTSWTTKKRGVYYFRHRLDAVFAALNNISINGKIEEVAEARGYLGLLKCFESVLLIVTLDALLGRTNTLSELLQSSQLYYARAIELSRAIENYLYIRI